MGQEAPCDILARRIVVRDDEKPDSLRFYTYTDCSILDAPPHLPDGDYTVHFEDFTFKTTCHRGLWLSCGPATRNQEIPAFDL